MDEHENAHRFFSADCFNKAWDLIEKSERTPEEDEAMLHLAYASHWHWSQRPDCTEKQHSVGCWQIARVYTLLGQLEPARHYAQLSLEAARRGDLNPFYWGYAWEALARAEAAAGNQAEAQYYMEQALACAQQVSDAEDRQVLMDDLANLRLLGTGGSSLPSA